MTERWLLVASRAPAPHVATVWDEAVALAGGGHDVTVLATDDACLDVVLRRPQVVEALDARVRIGLDRTAVGRRALLDRADESLLVSDEQVADLLLDTALRTVWR